MLYLSRRGFSIALFTAVASMFLPVDRVIAQDSGSSTEMVAAIQSVDDPSFWRVILAEGEARWRRLPTLSIENSWQVVETGINLPPGTELLTGNDGQVRLSRAEDSIRIGPDTWLTLESDAGDLITRIRQNLGVAWYSVRSRLSGRFRVDTTRLVAVVKGTRFEIAVGPDADELWVRKGVVNAQSTFGGGDIDVRAGQGVRADASGLQLIAAPGGGGGDGGDGGGRQTPNESANPPQDGGPRGGGNPGRGGNNRNGDKHDGKQDDRDGDKHDGKRDNRDGDKHQDKHGDKHGGKSRDGKGKGKGSKK